MRKAILFLIGIFVFAFFLRVFFLKNLALTFHYDMARDAFNILQIIGGHLKILGPPSSAEGIFHGVFYYYLLAPAYWLGHGNPLAAAYWIAFLNSLSVFLTFYLTYQLTKKVGVSLLAAFLFAVSFDATQYATWLSNPTLGIWTVPLIYIGLWSWIKQKKSWGPIVTALGLGLSFQAWVFLIYHIFPIAIWLWVGRKSITKKSLAVFIGVFLLSISTMLVAEVKFGFKSIGGLVSIFSGADTTAASKQFSDFIILYINQYGKLFNNSILPANIGYAGALGIGALIWLIIDWVRSKKEKISWQPFLGTYLLASLAVVPLGTINTPYSTVGLGIAVVLVTAILINKLWEKDKIFALLILLIVIASNLTKIFSENSHGQTTFSIPTEMTISYQMAVLDYTYKEAGGKPFSINSVTLPLWVNTTWSYLYNWYGKNKYGYLPQWHGRDQVGQLGNNLPPTSSDTKLYFLIIDPPQGIGGPLINQEIASEDSVSKIIEERSFGQIRVQKRERISKGTL